MDRFHIYDQVGAGRFSSSSLVYKGRERRTVQYVGIKRVPKEKMVAVGGYVSLLHRLGVKPKSADDSKSRGRSKKTWYPTPFIIKFFDWYETRSNLWLILEFLPGGSLKSLMESTRQECEVRRKRVIKESANVTTGDNKSSKKKDTVEYLNNLLPESSIAPISSDILSGLVFANTHGGGIILGGVEPGGVLLDEFGRGKISKFGGSNRPFELPRNGDKSDTNSSSNNNSKSIGSGTEEYSADFEDEDTDDENDSDDAEMTEQQRYSAMFGGCKVRWLVSLSSLAVAHTRRGNHTVFSNRSRFAIDWRRVSDAIFV